MNAPSADAVQNISYKEMPETDCASALTRAGLPEWLARMNVEAERRAVRS